MLKTFVGYKGKMAAAQIDRPGSGGKIQFVILAKNEKQLSILWDSLIKSGSLDRSSVDSAILIRANILPGKRAHKEPLTTSYVEVTTTRDH
jgi:hypothetical protein